MPGLYLKESDVRPLIRRYSWSTGDAVDVVFGPTPPNPKSPRGCPNGESAGNTFAVGLLGERGLFQIAVVHKWRFERRGWTWDDAFVPDRNVAIAYEIYEEAKGWWPWSCQPD